MVSKHQPTFKLILCYGTLSIAPCIAPQGGPNGVNHISMYLGYHNIEIKTRDFLKLNFGIWNIVRFLAGFCVKYITFPTSHSEQYGTLGRAGEQGCPNPFWKGDTFSYNLDTKKASLPIFNNNCDRTRIMKCLKL